jgi:flagellin FlaB
MRKLLFNKKNDGGAIGLGAMIVLIAMILVAGVAASVIISTSTTLQSQAMKTGAQTIREVSSGINVFSIVGYVPTGEEMVCLAITIEGRPGADRIDLNNTFILISDGTTKSLLSYEFDNSTAPDANASFFNASVTGDLFTAVNWSLLDSDKFAVGVLQDYDGSMATQFNPTLNRGDKACLFINMNTTGTFSAQLPTRTEVFGQVIPEIGAPGVIGFTSPMAYFDVIYTLQ